MLGYAILLSESFDPWLYGPLWLDRLNWMSATAIVTADDGQRVPHGQTVSTAINDNPSGSKSSHSCLHIHLNPTLGSREGLEWQLSWFSTSWTSHPQFAQWGSEKPSKNSSMAVIKIKKRKKSEDERHIMSEVNLRFLGDNYETAVVAAPLLLEYPSSTSISSSPENHESLTTPSRKSR